MTAPAFDPASAVAALEAGGALALCTWRVVDGEARLEGANAAFQALLGRPAHEVTWRALTGSDTGVPADGAATEYSVVAEDGRPRVVLITTVPGARPDQLVSVAVDVTEEVRQRRDAERASAAKSRFLAVMSHELRTPLNVISGQVDLLRDGVHGPLAERQQEALGRVHRAERQLKGLIDEVLAFSRLEMGEESYDVRPVSLEPVVRSVVDSVASQCAARQQALDVELPAENIMLLADEEKLRRALLAIASNACKFTPAQGRVIIDTATRAEVPEFFFIRITDTGDGVPAEHFENIFSPFAQVDERRARTAEGLGLGLTIARDLVRGMGGDVRVRSRVGEGSTFTVAVRRPH